MKKFKKQHHTDICRREKGLANLVPARPFDGGAQQDRTAYIENRSVNDTLFIDKAAKLGYFMITISFTGRE